MHENFASWHCTNARRALRHSTISLIAAVLLLGGCSSAWRVPPSGSSLSGRVVDPQDRAVPGVKVRVADRLVAVTDPNGRFVLRSVPITDRVAVSFSAPAFMSTTRIYDATTASRGNTIVIWPRAAPARLQVSEGGTLSFDGGTITFPPEAFIDPTGRQVTGEVTVAMSVLDITDPRQLASAPGDFTARMRNGTVRNLETFGLFELLLTDARGQSVDLAAGRPATVELQVRETRQRELPAVIGSFSFEPRTGRWLEQPTPFQSRPSTVWTQISTGGWWNADLPYDTTCLKVRVLGCHTCDQAAPGPVDALVKASPSPNSYTGASYQDNTGNDGEVCLPVKKGALVDIKVSYGGRDHDLLDIATSPLVLSAANCSSCPLVTATHVLGQGFSNDLLTAYDSSRWCRSKHWNGSPFINAWLQDAAHVNFTSSGLVLTLNDEDALGRNCITDSNADCQGANYVSGEYKTNCFYGYGTYSATIEPPPWSSSNKNDGLVIGFFTFTNDDPTKNDDDGTIAENNATPPWDEIDIEVLGRHPIPSDCDTSSPCDPSASIDPNTHNCQNTDLVVQTNFIGKGIGINLNEERYCLPYGTYTYSFTWTANSITWSYTDSNNTTKTLRTKQRISATSWPTQPSRVFMNLWGNDVTGQSGAWAGTFTYSAPVSARFSNVTVPP